MKIAESFIAEMGETLAAQGEKAPKLIPVENTPFFLSESGDGIIPYGKMEREGVVYYYGTIDPEE